MTATVVSLFQHPEAAQSRAVRDARLVLHSPIKQEARDLRTACHVLQTWGDSTDALMARQMLMMLDRADLAAPDPAMTDDTSAPAFTVMLLIAAASAVSVALANALWVML
jgi:hypothetical protein